MDNQTRICVSTSLWNQDVSFQQFDKDVAGEREKNESKKKMEGSRENETLTKNFARPIPEHPGTERINDEIGSSSERRKGTPQEEFIEVEPNFSEHMTEEEKEELLERSRKENKKVN